MLSFLIASTIAAIAGSTEHAPKKISKRGLHHGHVSFGHGPGYGYGHGYGQGYGQGYGHGYGHGYEHGYGYGHGGEAFTHLPSSFAAGPLHHHVPTAVVSKIVKVPVAVHHQVSVPVVHPVAVEVKKPVAVAHPLPVVVEKPVPVPVYLTQPNKIVTPVAVAQPSLALSLGVASSPSSAVSQVISGQPAASYGVPDHLTPPATSYGVPTFSGHLATQPSVTFAFPSGHQHRHYEIPSSAYGAPKSNFVGGGASSGVALGSVGLAGGPSHVLGSSSFGTSDGYSYPVPSKKFL